MNIHVHLHGALRDKLPPDAKGRAILHFEEGATANAVITKFSLRGHIEIAINQELIENEDTILHDGDTLEIFRPAAGG